MRWPTDPDSFPPCRSRVEPSLAWARSSTTRSASGSRPAPEPDATRSSAQSAGSPSPARRGPAPAPAPAPPAAPAPRGRPAAPAPGSRRPRRRRRRPGLASLPAARQAGGGFRWLHRDDARSQGPSRQDGAQGRGPRVEGAGRRADPALGVAHPAAGRLLRPGGRLPLRGAPGTAGPLRLRTRGDARGRGRAAPHQAHARAGAGRPRAGLRGRQPALELGTHDRAQLVIVAYQLGWSAPARRPFDDRSPVVTPPERSGRFPCSACPLRRTAVA
jgi:hypothetical protein